MERFIIVVTGPESSGKSQLCAELSKHLNLPWVQEFARTYLEQNGPEYDKEILKDIYKGHLQKQEKILSAHPKQTVILDTDSINFIIWSEQVFGEALPEVTRQITLEQNHIYLICAPDLDWEPDPLRENPKNRQLLFKEHEHHIRRLNRPFRIVSGKEKERLSTALDALKDMGLRSD
jgi:nicotinamide riboside kinase